ncbi:hypothetical protein HZH66_010407 [Vespula vulgaris]|uniref:Uncharacterized protein n=2 Tax=Vespula TaxID=7451 RepID=A0A834MYJ4_VESVU|nr:hypothetical protein HZH66_010407 [Vespula vulgaris]
MAIGKENHISMNYVRMSRTSCVSIFIRSHELCFTALALGTNYGRYVPRLPMYKSTFASGMSSVFYKDNEQNFGNCYLYVSDVNAGHLCLYLVYSISVFTEQVLCSIMDYNVLSNLDMRLFRESHCNDIFHNRCFSFYIQQGKGT